MDMYHVSSNTGLDFLNPSVVEAYKFKGPLVFASPLLSFASCFGSYWKPQQGKILTRHTEDTDEPKYYDVDLVKFIISRDVNLDQLCAVYRVRGSDFIPLEYHDGLEYISHKRVRVVSKEVITWRELMIREGVKIVEV